MNGITEDAVRTVAAALFGRQRIDVHPHRWTVSLQYRDDKLFPIVRAALEAAHLTDDGAGSGEPAVAAGEVGSNPTGNPAPSSPHRPTCGTTYGESCDGYCPTPAIDREVLTQMLKSNRFAPYVSDERLAGMVVKLVRAPAIDREALRAAERQQVAQSIRDEAVDEAVDGFVQLTAVIRMCEEAGR